MADNKNFDSVFADCTKDELEFDVIFGDEDDILVDLVAGVDEAGIPLTGEDFDFSTLNENDDMVGEKPDFDYQKDGDGAYDLKDAEGTKDENLEIGGEVGDGKVVSGKEDSAMSNADEVTKQIEDAIGANDKQQTKLQENGEADPAYNSVDPYKMDDKSPLADDDKKEREEGNIEESTLDEMLDMLNEDDAVEVEDDEVSDPAETDAGVEEAAEEPENGEEQLCPDCGKNPCECAKNENCDPLTDLDDQEARAGATCADATDAPEVDKVEEAAIDNLLNMLEADDPIEDQDDEKMRDGSANRPTDDVEGVSAEVIDTAIKGDKSEDAIEDKCDTAERQGEVKHSTDEVEGVSNHVVDAALESVDDLLNMLEADDPIEDQDDEKMREGEAKRDTENVEGVDNEVIDAALESDNIDDLLAAVEDDDDVDLDSVIDAEDVVGDEVQQDLTHDADIKTNEAAEIDELVSDIDDDDIKEVEDNTDSTEAKIEYDNDDDDLIDAVINGLDI